MQREGGSDSVTGPGELLEKTGERLSGDNTTTTRTMRGESQIMGLFLFTETPGNIIVQSLST